jgi:hypothetical protein
LLRVQHADMFRYIHVYSYLCASLRILTDTNRAKYTHVLCVARMHTHTYLEPDVDECAVGAWSEPAGFKNRKGFMAPLCTNCSFGHDLEFVNPLYKTFAGMLDITECFEKDELKFGV